jgi:hypothetical protein
VPFDLVGCARIAHGRVDIGACEVQSAVLDIRPGACPNVVNRKSRGVLPVAVLGAEGFDVSAIDQTTVMLSRADGVGASVAPLAGPPGPGTIIEDVSSPSEAEACTCPKAGPDGTADLLLKFSTAALIDGFELDGVDADTPVELRVTGMLLDGTPFRGTDCIRLLPGH